MPRVPGPYHRSRGPIEHHTRRFDESDNDPPGGGRTVPLPMCRHGLEGACRQLEIYKTVSGEKTGTAALAPIVAKYPARQKRQAALLLTWGEEVSAMRFRPSPSSPCCFHSFTDSIARAPSSAPNSPPGLGDGSIPSRRVSTHHHREGSQGIILEVRRW